MKMTKKEMSRDAKYAYKMGIDYAINGANTTNCNFAIFSSPENTKAWEKGKRDAEYEIQQGEPQ